MSFAIGWTIKILKKVKAMKNNDSISRSALLEEHDRQHEGEPGKVRKLIEDAPAVDAVEVDEEDDCAACRIVYSHEREVQE